MSLSKDQIIQANDLTREPVEIAEWGGTVYVRTMTGAERDGFEAAIYQLRDGKVEAHQERFRTELAVRTICDESGARLFADDDVALVGGKSSSALDKILSVARKLNGLGADEAKEVEKN